ncbi:MAG: O-succinylhomoserine sulfhydrylase [Acidiferrobacterales bacterium]|nr:O-succinylhomoserine sulfhydrylase [Acidiferrobacterales bacterium]
MTQDDKDGDKLGFTTRAIRLGHRRGPEGEQAEPIYATSSFVFESAAQAAARFSGEEVGNVYSRYTNPTVRIFEERLAALEEGERCVGTASGMSAILATFMSLLKAGDHIVASRSLFGATIVMLETILARFGVTTTFVPLTDIEAWKQAIRPNSRMLFLETPSNPVTEIADIGALAELARSHRALLVVDNCFCTPALQQPLNLGADIVVHSATKYLDGQGRCVGGAVIGSETLVGKEVFAFMRTAGPTMSPFNAWVFLKGLETLALRMRAHSENAAALASWIETQPRVKRVCYPGLPSHPQHALAMRQQRAPGGLLAFELDGDREEAWRFIDATVMVSRTANLGDTKTLITHPASTTHYRMSPEARTDAGITEGLVRIAAGLEDIEDIKHDLQRGFDAIR